MLIRGKQLNNQPDQTKDQRLKNAKKDMLVKGGLVVFTTAVTIVLIFAMTAAWFTNVASTGNLNFQVESWGFDGDVEVEQGVINASPGASGYLSMKIASAGEKDSRLSVNISKEFMSDPQLQQRVFFYAEKSAIVNGEQVDRIYLNNGNGYTYYLPAMNQLILSESIFTDVRLKWEWVYDVVGYYFRGTQNGNEFEISEYLRPAEYNFDNAQFDEDGNLLKVDASTDVLQYIAQLTATDGYPGAYTVGTDSTSGNKVLMQNGLKVTPTLGCYPIDPANNIWLYLCTRQEILNHTAWDTQYGMSGLNAQQLFQVRLTVIGEQTEPQIMEVADSNGLKDALLSGEKQTIKLQQSVALNETITLPAGTQAVLDLNGHELSSNQATIFSVTENASLTMLNGTVSGDSANTVAVRSVGGQVTLSKVKTENVKNAVYAEDYKTTDSVGANSFIRILDCELSSESATIMLHGDGSASEERAALVVQNSTIHSNYMGIAGNGTVLDPGRYGTDIQIVGSDVYGLYAGVYHPQPLSTMTVTNSKVSGWTGLAIKGGDVYVNDSIITGLATDAEAVIPTEDKLYGSGFVDTGDGIYLETSYGYPINLTVSGNSQITCTAQTAYAVRVYPESATTKVYLNGGFYSTDVSALLQSGYVCEPTADGQFAVKTQK
ncbi:MAG: hypothetical protein E7447_02095 [Ruminococcaceae bacterium]|nr:hypothetical protein [Oscillospiraceae bacterium]